MRDDQSTPAPDLRAACVAMFGVNLAWVLVAIWAIWGLAVAGLLAVALSHLMTRLRVWFDARAERQRRDPKPRAWWQAP